MTGDDLYHWVVGAVVAAVTFVVAVWGMVAAIRWLLS